MVLFGGGKAAEKLHAEVIEKLKEMGYSAEEAQALRSLLYHEALKDAEKKGKTYSGIEKGTYMLKHTTKKHIEKNFPDDVIQEKIKLLREKKVEREKKAKTKRVAQAAGRRRASRKAASKKALSKKKRASSKKKKRVSSRKTKSATR